MFNSKVILLCALELSCVLSYQIVEITSNVLAESFSHETDDKVSIKLYYESLCPDCILFDKTELRPVVEKLAPYLNIKTFPYGNARTTKQADGTYDIECQHGPPECYGNRLHACVLDLLSNKTEAILFNICMMNRKGYGGSDDAAADKCGAIFGVDANAIKKCAKSKKGFDLLKMYGDLSNTVGFTEVPWVLINGNRWVGDDFMGDVCKAFKNPPQECDDELNIH